MVIMLTQCDERGRQNIFGYDKLLLIGFDYSWKDNYYAFNQDGDGKINYMKTVYGKNLRGEMIFSSNNLVFSVKWLDQYINIFKLNAYQCSGLSILRAQKVTEDLDFQMKYSYRPEDSIFVKQTDKMRLEFEKKNKQARETIKRIFRDHELAVMSSV